MSRMPGVSEYASALQIMYRQYKSLSVHAIPMHNACPECWVCMGIGEGRDIVQQLFIFYTCQTSVIYTYSYMVFKSILLFWSQ